MTLRGFACNVRIMGVRLWSWCTDDGFSEGAFIDGLQYAVGNGATVVSNSLQLLPPGGTGAALEAAIYELGNHDVVFVTSAGNANQDVDDPLSVDVYPPQRVNFSHVINVGATDPTNGKWTASNFGSTTIDVMAPGVAIRTFGANAAAINGLLYGTSFSTPMVAAAAAMYRSLNPSATAADVRDAVNASAQVLPGLQPYCESGGMLDINSLLP